MELLAPVLVVLAAVGALGRFADAGDPRRTARWLAVALVASAVAVSSVVMGLSLRMGVHHGAHALFDGISWVVDPVQHGAPAVLVPTLLAAVLLVLGTGRAVRAWLVGVGSGGRLQVVEDGLPVAFAENGRRGGVVVSTGMLAALAPDERRALLAHEESHRRHRHDRFLLAAEVASVVWPLRPAARRLRHALERWADEDAAAAVGDRTLVARAVARAALARHQPGRIGGVPRAAITGGEVPRRVEALLAPAPGPAPRFLPALGLLAALAAGAQLAALPGLLAAVCPWGVAGA